MRSRREDRTTRAIIRDEALRLFAGHGCDAVTVRQIAAAAGVSPGLVIHHFGSKDGLREVTDQLVFDTYEAMLGEMTAGPGRDVSDPAATGSLAARVAAHLPPGSPVPAYLGRMLLDGGEAGRRLFRRLFAAAQATIAAMAEAGTAAPGRDPDVRAAFLLSNDLAVVLLRDHIADVLGTDPLSAEGMARWAGEVFAVYGGGLLASPQAGGGARRPPGQLRRST
jgi:AcrR family transcriptional regulator